MADASDKLVDHLKELFADSVHLYIKVEGFCLAVEGWEMLMYHKTWKKMSRKINKQTHLIGHTIRELQEIPPASLDRIVELSELKDIDEAPDFVKMNKILFNDMKTIKDRAVKAHDRAHETKEYGIAGIVAGYIKYLDHWMWHELASTICVEPDYNKDADGNNAEFEPEKL